MPTSSGYQDVRDRLWAVSYGEREPDTASVSAPVFGVTGELQGALALSGPRHRLSPPELMRSACRQVLEIASAATLALGGEVARYAQVLEQIAVGRCDFAT
jgi:DNA-binding IclR family transcriptional regulator